MRVEEVVRLVALAFDRKAHDVDEHVREAVARVRAVRAALHLEVEEQATVAGEDRDVAHRAILLEAAQGGDLVEARPV
ncbi:MAG: hypothetical protein ABWY07_03555, partial [Burkholderiales bacterium]